MPSADLEDAWTRALTRYAELDVGPARFNVTLLEALRDRWASTVRPDTSMFILLFTRPGSTGYKFDERVEVILESEDRVRMALVRNTPRRGEDRPVGPMTVTGDYTHPANALLAVEALLFQLAPPADAEHPAEHKHPDGSGRHSEVKTRKFYRRRSVERRGDKWDAWGPCVYLFEVGPNGLAVRQIEQYEDGPTLRYELGDEDEYGFLTHSTFDIADWAQFEVSLEVFVEAWSSPKPR